MIEALTVADVFIQKNTHNMNIAVQNPERACVQSDPEVFFPERETIKQSAEAVALCGTCPTAIRAGCLAIALENREGFGIWGGLRTPERTKLLSKPYHPMTIV